jgi:DNA-directed RNA polymerase subunit M/transcription elongation factor TFIIS
MTVFDMTAEQQGNYYGYPTCCIAHFVKHRLLPIMPAPLTSTQNILHSNTGFIPCPDCADKLIKENKELSSLISRRICPYSFPKDESDVIQEEVDALVAKNPIKSEEEYTKVMEKQAAIIHRCRQEKIDPNIFTPEGKELLVLAMRAEVWENFTMPEFAERTS